MQSKCKKQRSTKPKTARLKQQAPTQPIKHLQ